MDILLSGYTQVLEAYFRDGRFFLNPGSATGAWKADAPFVPPQPSPSKPEQSSAAHNASTANQDRDPDTPRDAPDTEASAPAIQNAASNAHASSTSGTGTDATTTPSFACMYTPLTRVLDIQGPQVVVYSYQLIDDEVKVEKVEYNKQKAAESVK